MNEQPLVSVICITYNHEKYIAQAIESFLMQKTTFPFEVLICDDASTDSTQSIIRKYEEKSPSIIHAIYQTENQHSSGKSNIPLLMQRAKGKYFAVCEGDDYWTDEYKLENQVTIMEAHSECTGCCHNTKAVNETGIPHAGKIQSIHYRKEDVILDKSYLKANCRFCRTPSILIRASVMPKTSEEWEKYNRCKANGDMKLSAIVAATGKMYFIAKNMADYRYVTTPGSGSWNARNRDKNINLIVYNSLENIKAYIEDAYHCEICYDDYCTWLFLNALKQYVKKRTEENRTILRSLFEKVTNNRILAKGIFHYIANKIKNE